MDQKEVMRKREEFHRKLRQHELLEGYSYDDGHAFVTRPYWPLEPKNSIQPHLWKWSEIRPLVVEAGDMVGLGRGSQKYDRRVLALSNPGSGSDFTMTGPLFGDIQLIRPGESAPCHRHTPCATRIILEGSGGWTNVSGERKRVQSGDIVYTGQFPWHDHGNDGSDDFIFLDVLDIPLLYFTGTSSWEFDYEPITGSKDVVNQPAKVTDFPNDRYTNAQLRPTFGTSWKRSPTDFAHLSWDQAKSATAALAEEKGCPYDGICLEMRGTDGGAVGTTVSVHTQWIRPGENTLSHRHTGASVHVCVEGKGRARIEDKTYDFVRGDLFVIPSWHWHSFESASGCRLHAVSDLVLIEKMNLYREQRKTQDGRVLDSGWTSTSEPFNR